MSRNNLVTKSDLSAFYEKIFPYLGGGTKLAGPVGMIISYMGNTAPNGYLACDGTWYNIGDYPKLANWMMEEFESYSYFALSGETVPTGKFKVPDLRGEFLRGTGTNSHANQGSGGDVGEHQDGTLHLKLASDGSLKYFQASSITSGYTSHSNADSQIKSTPNNGFINTGVLTNYTDTNSVTKFTSRPTNTSVLYCIKYEEYEGQDDFLYYFSQNTFRGKNLGSTFTEAQKAAIARGDFRDLWNGDYWEDQSGRRWRIVDNTEPFLYTGDTEFTKHHLVVMPDDNLVKADGTTHYMNNTDTTTGGYAGTKYRSTYRTTCKNLFTAFFGSSFVASHREMISNAMANEKASAWAWNDCDVELPTEINMYGSVVWSMGGTNYTGFNVGVNKTQFKLFDIKPAFIINQVDSTNAHFWLRDVTSTSAFARLARYAHAGYAVASDPLVGFRPYALIVGN